MKRFTWALLGILLALGGTLGWMKWPVKPFLPFQFPNAKYLTDDRAYACTQPFFPEIYSHDYQMPDKTMVRVLGILVPDPPNMGGKHLPGLVWMFWKNVEKEHNADQIWLTFPGKKPELITKDMLIKRFGNNICDALMPFYPKQDI